MGSKLGASFEMRKTKKQMEADDFINTQSSMESLPKYLLVNDIFLKLDLENLCSLSCVSTMFRSSASEALALLPSLNLSVSTLSFFV